MLGVVGTEDRKGSGYELENGADTLLPVNNGPKIFRPTRSWVSNILGIGFPRRIVSIR